MLSGSTRSSPSYRIYRRTAPYSTRLTVLLLAIKAQGEKFEFTSVQSSVVDPDPNLDLYRYLFCNFVDLEPYSEYGSTHIKNRENKMLESLIKIKKCTILIQNFFLCVPLFL